MTHKNLAVWNDSIEMVTDLYRLTKNLPSNEQYGLVGQIRRAAVSIPANISEGAARNSAKDYIRFLRISFGSLSELETLLLITMKLGLITQELHEGMQGRIYKTAAQLAGLIKAIERSSEKS